MTMEYKPTSQELSVMRAVEYGMNVSNYRQACIIRKLIQKLPGLIVTTSGFPPIPAGTEFGAILTQDGRKFIHGANENKR